MLIYQQVIVLRDYHFFNRSVLVFLHETCQKAGIMIIHSLINYNYQFHIKLITINYCLIESQAGNTKQNLVGQTVTKIVRKNIHTKYKYLLESHILNIIHLQ